MIIELNKKKLNKIHDLYMQENPENPPANQEILNLYRDLLIDILEAVGKPDLKQRRTDFGWEAGDENRDGNNYLVDEDCISIRGQRFWWIEIDAGYPIEIA